MRTFTIIALLVGCGGSPPPVKTDPSADVLAAEQRAFVAAKPVFDKFCASCHTQAGKQAAKKKLDHFDMDTYPFGGHHTATIGFTIREVLGINGQKPTMPDDDPGAVRGDDLAKIKAWTDAWEAADKVGAHGPAEHHDHDDHDDHDDDDHH
jgi:mono/diheme cytochrome c family protein